MLKRSYIKYFAIMLWLLLLVQAKVATALDLQTLFEEDNVFRRDDKNIKRHIKEKSRAVKRDLELEEREAEHSEKVAKIYKKANENDSDVDQTVADISEFDVENMSTEELKAALKDLNRVNGKLKAEYRGLTKYHWGKLPFLTKTLLIEPDMLPLPIGISYIAQGFEDDMTIHDVKFAGKFKVKEFEAFKAPPNFILDSAIHGIYGTDDMNGLMDKVINGFDAFDFSSADFKLNPLKSKVKIKNRVHGMRMDIFLFPFLGFDFIAAYMDNQVVATVDGIYDFNVSKNIGNIELPNDTPGQSLVGAIIEAIGNGPINAGEVACGNSPFNGLSGIKGSPYAYRNEDGDCVMAQPFTMAVNSHTTGYAIGGGPTIQMGAFGFFASFTTTFMHVALTEENMGIKDYVSVDVIMLNPRVGYKYKDFSIFYSYYDIMFLSNPKTKPFSIPVASNGIAGTVSMDTVEVNLGKDMKSHGVGTMFFLSKYIMCVAEYSFSETKKNGFMFSVGVRF